jgi:hypothetical protein
LPTLRAGLCVQQGLELGRGFVNVVRTEEQILLSAWTKMGLGDGALSLTVAVLSGVDLARTLAKRRGTEHHI